MPLRPSRYTPAATVLDLVRYASPPSVALIMRIALPLVPRITVPLLSLGRP